MSAKFNFTTLETGFEALWPVTVKVPQDGGEISIETFEARLRAINKEEAQAAIASEDPFAVYKAAIVAVPNAPPIRDAAGQPLAFFDKLLTPEWMRDGFDEAFREFRKGVAAKN